VEQIVELVVGEQVAEGTRDLEVGRGAQPQQAAPRQRRSQPPIDILRGSGQHQLRGLQTANTFGTRHGRKWPNLQAESGRITHKLPWAHRSATTWNWQVPSCQNNAWRAHQGYTCGRAASSMEGYRKRAPPVATASGSSAASPHPCYVTMGCASRLLKPEMFALTL